MKYTINLDPAPDMAYGFANIEWPTSKWHDLSDIINFMAKTFKLSIHGKSLQTMATRFHRMLKDHKKETFVYRFKCNTNHFGEDFMETAQKVIDEDLLPKDLDIDILKDFWITVDRQFLETDEFHQKVLIEFKDSTNPIEKEIYDNLQKDPWDR